MKIEGEPSKRYRLSYWGQFLGSYDTAAEALERYERHEKLMQPATDSRKKGRYTVCDGREREITLADLRKAAAAEK
jgi:hypothetical protein